MKRFIILLLVGWFAASAAHSAAQDRTKRQVSYSPGVEIGRFAPLQGYFPGDISAVELVRGHAPDAEAVLVIRIDKKAPHLTPDKDWIRTTYWASMIEQLRPQGRLASRSIRIEQDGGALQIQGVAVTAIADWEPRDVLRRGTQRTV